MLLVVETLNIQDVSSPLLQLGEILNLKRNFSRLVIWPSAHLNAPLCSRRDSRNVRTEPTSRNRRNRSCVLMIPEHTRHSEIERHEADDCLRAYLRTRNISHLSFLGRPTSDCVAPRELLRKLIQCSDVLFPKKRTFTNARTRRSHG